MPQYSNQGQFGGSAYNNPQMNQGWGGGSSGGFNPGSGGYGYGGGNYGNAPQGAGWFNPNSPMGQWQGGFVPGGALWQGEGGAPGHQGQDYSYNPFTGQGQWVNSTEGLVIGSGNYGTGGTGTAAYIDPVTGMKTINPSVLQGLVGGFGGGSGGGYQNYEMTDFQGQNVSAPGGYEGFDYSTIGSGIDPGAVIDAQEYKLQEAMEGDMARAGGRLGQSGFAMSTPYAGEVAGAARKAAQDRNAITMQYQYDAAQQQAKRDLAQQLQAGQHDFGGWQTQGGWDMQGQMANQGNALSQWMMENQLGMQNNQGQNQWNQQNQQNQQQMLASILGGLF